jgi:acylglycerol lipase
LHGTADKLTNPEGSKKLAESSKSSDKTLNLYPGLVHDLVHEPEKVQVIEDIMSWLEKRAP